VKAKLKKTNQPCEDVMKSEKKKKDPREKKVRFGQNRN
jgi:hypothetical protein